jgi:foldase protein PrsA
MVVALLVGCAIGAIITRQRIKARQAVASVNGTVIDQDTFFDRLQAEAGVAVLRKMVSEELVLQFAKAKGAYPSDTAVDARYKLDAATPGFAQKLQAANIMPDDYKRQLRSALAEVALLAPDVKVTDEDIHSFYERNINPANPRALYYTPESAQVAVIVTNDQDSAQKAEHQLVQGIPFGTVVKTFTVDVASKANNGVLPMVARGRTRLKSLPGLEDTIFGLKVGERVGPRQFAGKWWILQCIDRKPAVTRKFEDVRDACRDGVILEKASARPSSGLSLRQRRQQEYTDFMKQANTQAFWTRYAWVVRLQK